MRIKFKAPDPRAGTTAQMDSSRGQHFVDTGAASVVSEDRVTRDEAREVENREPKAEATAPKPAKKTTAKKAG